MTTTLTALAEKALQIADERPDFIYESPEGEHGDCYYFHEDLPGCIWGHVFAALDVEIPRRYNGYGIESILRLLFKHEVVVNDLGTFGIEDAYRAFSKVQREQDEGATWADAVVPLRELLGPKMAA